ncbi:MAG TPA: bile acid:sodium symporter [Pyrinomonadaceae bacterium]|nr:bile acid:sodium symporter [Pyrinomonadaceae bacterium]
MSLSEFILLVLKISIVLSVLAIGLNVTFADTAYLFRKPGLLGKALLSMYVVMPIVALVLALSFDLNPAVKVALVTLSVSPIPPILPNKEFKAGGSANYTIGLLVATGLLAVVITPLILEVFERVTGRPLGMPMSTIAAKVLATILVPLVIGIAIRTFAPSIGEKVAKPLAKIAAVLLLLGLVPVLISAGRAILSLIGDGTLLSLGAFALVGLLVGHLLGGPETENRRVLALSTASRHPAVALGIAHANFPNQKFAVAAIFLYVLLSTILSVPYISWLKRADASKSPSENHAEA